LDLGNSTQNISIKLEVASISSNNGVTIGGCLIDRQDMEYSNLYTLSSTEETKLSGWSKVALDIIKEAFYYKNIRENKFSQVYLISPLFYFWKILECGCFCL
jgi:hypothetical protein